MLLNFILFMGVGWVLRKYLRCQKFFKITISGALIASFLWLVVTSIAYLATPLFFDHSESNIGSVGTYWWLGNSLYTELSDVHRYSLLYGPWPYMVAGFFQSLGDNTIFLIKLPGVLNLFVFIAAVFVLARDLRISPMAKFLSVSCMAAMLLGFYNFSYWIRPDSYLITYVFLGFLLVKKSDGNNSWLSYIAMGVLAALAANCKAHGFIYFFPLLAYHYETHARRLPVVKLGVSIVVFFLFLSFPFTLPNVDFQNYIQWLELASHHGLQFSEFMKNFTFVSTFLLLLWLLGVQRSFPATFYTLLAASLLASIAGSKAGAGNNHLIPFLPVMLWLAIEKYYGLAREEQRRISLIMSAFILTLLLNAVNRQKRIVQLFQETPQRIQEFTDLKSIVEPYRGVLEMGYSSLDSYLSALYKPWLVRRYGTLLLDGASLMDLTASGVDIPSGTTEVLNNCEVNYFVISKNGEPWSLQSFYEKHTLFSEKFREVFFERYELIDQNQNYRIYGCKQK